MLIAFHFFINDTLTICFIIWSNKSKLCDKNDSNLSAVTQSGVPLTIFLLKTCSSFDRQPNITNFYV